MTVPTTEQPFLETARLRLSPLGEEHLEPQVAMDLDPAVQRYIRGEDNLPSADERRAELRQRLDSGWPSLGGMWAVEWKVAPGFLGWCGLFPLDNSDFVEIGYRYVRSAWGAGVATEAARAVLDHGFRGLGLDPIVAVTHPDNVASQNVLTKIGLARRGTGFHYGLQLPFFRLDRADYLVATSS